MDTFLLDRTDSAYVIPACVRMEANCKKLLGQQHIHVNDITNVPKIVIQMGGFSMKAISFRTFSIPNGDWDTSSPSQQESVVCGMVSGTIGHWIGQQ